MTNLEKGAIVFDEEGECEHCRRDFSPKILYFDGFTWWCLDCALGDEMITQKLYEEAVEELTPCVTLAWDENGDWVGFYLNGELKLQGHSIPTREVIKILRPDMKIKNLTVKIDSHMPEKEEELSYD